MAAIGTIQLAGNANAGPAEVETNTLAARYVARPNDFTSQGIYSAAQVCNFANGAGTSSPAAASGQGLLAFRCPTGLLAVVRKLTFSHTQSGTVATAKVHIVSAFKVHNWYLQDAGFLGISLVATPVGVAQQINGSKARSFMADPTADIVGTPAKGSNLYSHLEPETSFGAAAATAATLDPPTPSRVLDPQPFAAVSYPLGTVAGTGLTPTALLDVRAGDHPLVLQGEEGFVVQYTFTSTTIGASEVIDFGFNINWEELTIGW